MLNRRGAFVVVVALGVGGCGAETSPAVDRGSGGQATGGTSTAVTDPGTGGSGPLGGSSGSNTAATGGTTTGGSSGGTSSTTNSGGAAGSSIGQGGASGSSGQQPARFVGNITTYGGITDVGSLKFANYWNQVSPQNEGKWGSVSNARGQYNWGALDTLYKYTQANKIIFKEHTFIWGAQQPNYGIGESDVKDWMTQFCKRYPEVKLIDVVNEPPPHTNPSYANAIGGGTNGDWTWIANAFKWAREACPNAVLILNDYNNLEWDQDNKHFIDIVNAIKKAGAPIDAIGCQAHDLDHTGANGAFDVAADGVARRLAALAAVVPNIYITEMDISTKDDNAQLSLYKQYFPMFWESPNVKGITIWGWVVGQTWSMAPDSGLITSAGVKRPAFTWLLQQLGRG